MKFTDETMAEIERLYGDNPRLIAVARISPLQLPGVMEHANDY